ncbi:MULTISPECIES: serine protease [Pseudomonas]|uniref:serine protease n=1 Tax=Pseudomonas TaxID=286 RepID=UPI001E50C589|nr:MULTISPECIES: serine protease [Pseudomonas]WDG45268.1 serine protease [Pseudomonas chlororaphis]WDG57482.1 serine protease [Pseudomonas chlororaphis]WDG63695.1 serine protease [Pseudomonas chlororaphis]
MGRFWVTCFSSLVLAGCNGVPHLVPADKNYQGHFVVSSGFPLPYMFQGNAVQWNPEYAVSVKHIPLISNVGYSCSSGCDLAFIKHKAEGAIPVWRNYVKGEAITVVGFSPLLMTVQGQGVAKGMRMKLPGASDTTSYAVNDAPLVVGMSGGPVYGADGAVLGITVGMWMGKNPAFGELKTSDRLSVYLPYDIVLREWQAYSKQAGEVAMLK